MNAGEVLRRLRAAKREWMDMRKDGNGPEIEGAIRGIAICIGHVRDIAREMRSNERFRRPKVDHQHAGKLYKACKGALYSITMINRAAAIRILERAIAAVPTNCTAKEKSQ